MVKNLEQAQEYIEFVKQNLEPLAHHIEVSVEWLWNILVQQARVEAITYILVITLLSFKVVVLAVIASKSLKKATFSSGGGGLLYKNTKTGATIASRLQDWDNHEDYIEVTRQSVNTNKHGYIVYWTAVPAAILAIFTMIITSISAPIIITGLVNPQYRAIEKIVEFAKPEKVINKVRESK